MQARCSAAMMRTICLGTPSQTQIEMHPVAREALLAVEA